jgi:hypothetical protein
VLPLPTTNTEKLLKIIAWTLIVIAFFLAVGLGIQLSANSPEVITIIVQYVPASVDDSPTVYYWSESCQFFGNYEETERVWIEEASELSGISVEFDEPTSPVTRYDEESQQEVEVPGFSLWHCGESHDLSPLWNAYEELKAGARG